MKKLIDIENLLIWAFQNEAANLFDVGLDATAGYPRDCILRCEEVSVMGGFITGTSPGARAIASDSHPDAITVTDAMQRLDPDIAWIVAGHAKAGSRPDWRPDAHFRFEPQHWEWDEGSGEEWGRSENCPYQGHDEGWPNAWYDPIRKNTVRRTSRWCPVVTKDSPGAIARARSEYMNWVGTLSYLREQLHRSLADWELSEYLPGENPWSVVEKNDEVSYVEVSRRNGCNRK